jgi:hypothetical protein
MDVVPISKQKKIAESDVEVKSSCVGVAASLSLIAGGLLLLGGKRKAGTAVAASGAALALLDQKELVQEWWERVPGYIDDAQKLADQVENVVENVATRRDTLRRILARV